jgi:16S rRNA (guanine527-N7)-methyltransferase
MDNIALYTVCAQNGLKISDQQIQTLADFARKLLEWNKKINVISRRDEENFWARHILHCLTLLFKVEIPEGARVLDLGTGGGLPGMIIKIVRRDISFTLLDSTQKKINVVNDIIGSLNLTNIRGVWGRAEDLGTTPEHRRQYDIVVARAVAPLKDLALWAHPFLRRGKAGANSRLEALTSKKVVTDSTLLAFKGGDLENEINQLRVLPNIASTSIINLTLAGSIQLDDADKKIVVVEFGERQTENR